MPGMGEGHGAPGLVSGTGDASRPHPYSTTWDTGAIGVVTRYESNDVHHGPWSLSSRSQAR